MGFRRRTSAIKAEQLATDVAAVTAAKANIFDSTTVLGVAGTLAAADITLDHLGGIAGDSTVLSGCNIGGVTLTDCFGVGVASSLDLSDNRMDAAALETMLAAIDAAAGVGGSGATITLDITDNAVPNVDTMADIYNVCSYGGSTINMDGPQVVHVAGTLSSEEMVADYTWVATWFGAWAAPGSNGCLYADYHGEGVLENDDGDRRWKKIGGSMLGEYAPVAPATGTATVTDVTP